jgi:hypothetical protein
MDPIKFLALRRAVRNEAAKGGYRGDVLADAADVPLVGTLQEQQIIATIGADVRPRPTNESERRLLSRLVRATVLTSPAPEPVAECRRSGQDAIDRANRHSVAGRRHRRPRR